MAMHQTAPDPDILTKLVSTLRYREGWTFKLRDIDRGQGSTGLTLVIRIDTVDTYNPTDEILINHFFIVPAAAYNRASWQRWLLDQILLVERHEACEFFQIANDSDVPDRPFAPHHGFGEDPYRIVERGTDQDARTSYLNEKRDQDRPVE